MNILPEKPNGIVKTPAYPHILREQHPKRQLMYLQRAVEVLMKYRSLMAIIFFSLFALVAIVTFLLPPEYRANSTIIIERPVDANKAMLLGLENEQIRDLKDWLISEMKILQSDAVLSAVVTSQKLDQGDDDSAQLSEQEQKERHYSAVEKLKAAVIFDNPRKSNVINIIYDNSDPQLAANVINEIVAEYKKYRNKIYSQSESYEFFTKQLQKAEKELREIENKFAAYKKENILISPDGQIDVVLSKLAEYHKSLTATRTERIGRKAKINTIRKHLGDGELKSIPVLENIDKPSRYSYWAKLRIDLLNTEMRRDSLISNYTPEYKGVKDLDKQIETTRHKMFTEVQKILEEEESRIDALKAEEAGLRAAIDDIQQELRGYSEKEINFAELSREVESKRAVYSILLKQRDEANISLAKDMHGVAVRTVSAAIAPRIPIKPMKKLNLFLGFIFSICAALATALILEFFDNSIDTPEKVERYVGLPVLATVHDCEVKIKRAKIRHNPETRIA